MLSVVPVSYVQQSEEQYQGERYAAQIIDIGIALSAELDVWFDANANWVMTENELENIDLIGKGIVITGNFSIEREEIKTFLMKIGGQIKSGITGKVDFVFAGEDCGWSKIQKINDLNQSKKANIRILNEADLNYLIKKYGI